MKLFVATIKATGFQYYYTKKTMYGKTQYSADCSGDFAGPDAYKRAWYNKLTDARKGAEERGSLLPVDNK